MEYIEPCCVGRELLALLKEMPVVPFQTNGNVTLEYFMKGLSEFAGNELEITLAVPVIDIPMLRMLAWYNRRGWAKKVVSRNPVPYCMLSGYAFGFARRALLAIWKRIWSAVHV